jgi:hypothetical protein
MLVDGMVDRSQFGNYKGCIGLKTSQNPSISVHYEARASFGERMPGTAKPRDCTAFPRQLDTYW